MNEFDDRKATDPDHSSGEPPSPHTTIDQGPLLLRELQRQFITWNEVAKHLGVHRLTVRRWRKQGMSSENIEHAKATLKLAKKRDEIDAGPYVIHGEGAEPMPIEPLKQLVVTAVKVRKLGLVHQADEIDKAVIAMANELDEYYKHPSLVGGKLKAVKAASQTGLDRLHEAIPTYKEAAQEMHDAGEPGEEYRYDLSVLFLQLARAWKERNSVGSDLYIVLGRAKQFIEQQPPKEASPAARRQRYCIGLTVLALLPSHDAKAKKELKKAFLKWARRMMDDSDAYESQEAAYDALFAEVASHLDGRFTGVLEEGWLSSLRRG